MEPKLFEQAFCAHHAVLFPAFVSFVNRVQKEGGGAQPALEAASEKLDPVGKVVVDSSSLRDSPRCFWRWWQVGPGPTCHHLQPLLSAAGAEESTMTFPTGSNIRDDSCGITITLFAGHIPP